MQRATASPRHEKDHHGTSGKAAILVTVLCWLAVVADGFDLIVYGSVLPTLDDEPGWNVGAKGLSVIGAVTFLGMLIGAIVTGLLSDRLGRRLPLITCLVWFSLCMIGSALAPSPEVLGIARFLAGLGLGGLLPTASALLMEYAPPRHRVLIYAMAISGIPLGGVLAAMLSLPLLPEPGWRVLFMIGAAPLVLIVPVALRYLPESLEYLVSRGRTEEAAAVAGRFGVPLPSQAPAEDAVGPSASLFRGRNLTASLCFWVATFLALLTWYGLGTWLPGIMREAGYELGSAVGALLVLSIGGVIGSCLIAAVGDRLGYRSVAIASFLTAGTSLFLLSIPAGTLVLYLLLAVAGSAAVSTQVLINSFVGVYFPPQRRAGALGWTLGVGRTGAIVGPLSIGLIVDTGMSYQWNFYLFGACALLGAIAITMVPSGAGGHA
ncbi:MULTISPECIES: MFS transporter [Actinomadura]|uniref:Aromatic acid/H+ symport family MFS transporter n=1 Tax=Actinomadura geliboluensis TaxID=882440 RepID=A0A5S4G5N8_9ACTN|nr:aromatic acid/H+ symport family MFS transporter [Actinomadura geliboluensis]TMR27834.1 aromatic acid/H+ symport family MFS transporter [Actinomadura geliboluensis]